LSQSSTKNETVSSGTEPLILVDSDDNELGYMTKRDCHEGKGTLHRAFSVFIFNSKSELLIHQRAQSKALWPNFWSNSCCSHPRKGESIEQASSRRLREELGIFSSLKFLYKFEYNARYNDMIGEHELCHVLAGQTDQELTINATEIQDYRWVLPRVLQEEMVKDSGLFTPWFLLEFERVIKDYHPATQA
jgi:isopentenyl-diphosphate delta-isomerase